MSPVGQVNGPIHVNGVEDMSEQNNNGSPVVFLKACGGGICGVRRAGRDPVALAQYQRSIFPEKNL
jgi:hypothetical protein